MIQMNIALAIADVMLKNSGCDLDKKNQKY